MNDLVSKMSGQPALSVLAVAMLPISLVIAYLMKDTPSVTLLIGIIATNATTVVGYWFGSSAGSARKDSIIASRVGGQP